MGWIEDNTKRDPQAKEGMRIRMLHMDDQHGVDEGMEGTIVRIDDLGTLHVNWDDGSQLGVIPELDKYELLPAEDEQVDIIDLLGEANDPKPFLTGAKSTDMGKKFNKDLKSSLSKHRPKPDIKIESEEVAGGEAEGMSPEDLAKKHKVDIKDIEKEIKVGTKIEMEHTDSKKMAKEIAMDHIAEFPDYYTNKKYGVKASEKGLEKELEETTTTGALGATPIQPLGNPIRKTKSKKVSNNVITKGDLKNPLGKIYSLKKESKIIKAKDLLSEISSTHAAKLRDAEGTYDVDPWVGKKGWLRRNELVWKGGKIADIMAKLNINWNDSNLSLTDKETDAINEGRFKKTKESPIHTKKWERCVKDVEKKNEENKTDYNPYAVCQKSIGYEGSIKKPHRRQDKEEIEETTTFSSVFGGGFPVTPFMFAKKGKHVPSKKTLWKGGKIVQKVDRADLLGESLLDEINKVKWVKNGKFVKIKDKCAKYNNQPHCSQGAIDNPLELSDTAFENIKKVSKKTGLPEEVILERVMKKINEDTYHKLSLMDKLKIKLAGIDEDQVLYNLNNNLPIDWKGTKEGYYEKMNPRKNYGGSD